MVGQLPRAYRRAVRQLADVARPAHAVCAPACAPGKRGGVGWSAGAAPGGHAGVLSGSGIAPAACIGEAPAIRLRRDVEFRTGGRRGRGARVPGWAAVHHAGRIAGRRGKPGGASGHHDARGDGAGSAPRGGYLRHLAAVVGRHRGHFRFVASPACRAGARGCDVAKARGGARMNALLTEAECPRAASRRDIAVVLFGTGNVGGAFLQLLRTPAGESLRLVGAANSRHQQTQPEALAERRLRDRLDAAGEARDDTVLLRALNANGGLRKVIVDATASAELAARHPEWLARGCHVVTANKAL